MSNLLLLLVAVWTFPFLISLHTLPIATFYGEWVAALLYFFLLVSQLSSTWLQTQSGNISTETPKWAIPQMVLVPLGLLIALTLQAYLGVGEQVWVGRTAMLYAIAGVATTILAASLKETLGFERLIRILAWSTLGVAAIGSAIEIVQAFRLEGNFYTLISQVGTGAPRRMFGNLNQPNHQATLVSMGLAALVWLLINGVRLHLLTSSEVVDGELDSKNKRNLIPFQRSLTPFLPAKGSQNLTAFIPFILIALIPLLLIGMALTGSRTAWAHLGLIVLMGLGLINGVRLHLFSSSEVVDGKMDSTNKRNLTPFQRSLTPFFHKSETDAESKASLSQSPLLFPLLLVLSLPLLFALLQPLLAWASEAWHLGLFNTLNKFKEGASQSTYRMALWEHAWAMFRSHPWLGVGWGDFTWQQFLQLDRLAVVVEMANNGHNVILDLLAKVGAVGTSLIVLPLLVWLARMVKVLVPPFFFKSKSELADSFSSAVLSSNGQKSNQQLLNTAATTALPVVWVLMLLVHSMLEFPLHYMYFWLMFCFLIGATDTGRFPKLSMQGVVQRSALAFISACIVVGGSILLLATWVDYKKAEALYYEDAIKTYEASPALWWFSDYAEFGYVGTLPLGPDPISQADLVKREALINQAIHFNLLPSQVYRAAMYRALLGKTDEAYQLLGEMHWYYTYLPANTHAKGMVDLCDQLDDEQRPEKFCDTMEAWKAGKGLPAPSSKPATQIK